MRIILELEVFIRTSPLKLVEDIEKFCKSFPKIIDDLEALLTDNRIFKQRNVEIGIVNKQEAFRS